MEPVSIAPLVIFSTGTDSAADGRAFLRLRESAKDLGCQTINIDYRMPHIKSGEIAGAESARHLTILLGTSLPPHTHLILVGASAGAYISTIASRTLKPAGLFLMAPTFHHPDAQVQASTEAFSAIWANSPGIGGACRRWSVSLIHTHPVTSSGTRNWATGS
jgi:hypothetical protein